MPNDSLQPRYAESFHCIGSACEDSCCQGWGVYVDKATYKKYLATPALRRSTSGHLQLSQPSRDNFKFALIKFKDGTGCPFLTPNRLCGIQVQYGAEFLSKTCARYPRALVRFEGRLQRALYLSCPEAARLVLLSPQLLPVEEGVRYRNFRLENSQIPGQTASLALSQQIRSFALLLLQDRTYPLWQRLFLLGIVCRRVRDFVGPEKACQASQVLAQYAEMIAEGSLRATLDGVPARPAMQLAFVLQLIQGRFKVEQPEDGFAGCVADFLLAIGHSPGRPLEESARHYHDACNRYEQIASEWKDTFLENYLVNYLFRTRFPYPDTSDRPERSIDPICSYLLMIFHYRFLHSLLIGAAARQREVLSSSDAVRIAQAFAKSVEHNLPFLDELKSCARSSDLQDTDSFAVLLKT